MISKFHYIHLSGKPICCVCFLPVRILQAITHIYACHYTIRTYAFLHAHCIACSVFFGGCALRCSIRRNTCTGFLCGCARRCQTHRIPCTCFFCGCARRCSAVAALAVLTTLALRAVLAAVVGSSIEALFLQDSTASRQGAMIH
jgi:hypothetical protein